jgi:hypothetical protein
MTRTTTLAAGTVLFHGTDTDDFEERSQTLDGPSWLSSSRSVANHFAVNRAGAGGLKRIISYRLVRDIALFEITSSRGLQSFAQEHDFSPSSSESIREGVAAAGLPGWIIPNNYPDGDDILITDPGSILEYQETEYLVDEVLVSRMAVAFLGALHEEIGTENLVQVDARNREQSSPNVCHSHDFCDANMVMAHVWQQLTSCEVDVACQTQREIWNLAWDRAKAELPRFVQGLQPAERDRPGPSA